MKTYSEEDVREMLFKALYSSPNYPLIWIDQIIKKENEKIRKRINKGIDDLEFKCPSHHIECPTIEDKIESITIRGVVYKRNKE